MATIIQKNTNNASMDVNGNKKANATNDDNTKTIKQPHNNKGRCE